MSLRLHIFGASGSGTSTLGVALAQKHGIPFLDTDDFYWEVKYSQARPMPERLKMIREVIQIHESWVLAGSLPGWGDPLIPLFTHGIFVYLDPTIRLQRLLKREATRYGAAIEPNGPLYQDHLEFMEWARSYDTGSSPTRSLQLHQEWMQDLPFPVFVVQGNLASGTLEDKITTINTWLRS